MNYIIGVDGGGTKTEATAYNFDGIALATGYSSYANVLIDANSAINHITKAITKCLASLDAQKCVCIYLGLAGIDSGAHRVELEAKIQQFKIPFQIMNDVKLAHASLLKGSDGILTISGTGSVSFGIKGNYHEMSGGWGHLLGDEGSGYWIVIESLKKLIQDYDSMKRYSNLSLKLMEALNIKAPSDIKRFIYSANKGAVAALVPIIVKEAKNGDLQAQFILNEAGIHLAKMTLRLYAKLNFEPLAQVLVGIKGSILEQIDFVFKAFAKTVNGRIKNVQIINEQISATKGAYYLALKEQLIQK